MNTLPISIRGQILKKVLAISALAAALVLSVMSPALAKPASTNQGNGKAFVTEPGFDQWGYNYRAHMFSGDYCDAYEGASWCQPYVGTDLIMKWNEAWTSSSDLDGDGQLDRHFGFDTYRGSGAWITNHMSGSYELNGETCHWTYFTKIVAVPVDAVDSDPSHNNSGVFTTAEGEEIGPEVWGDFATVQEVINDPCDGYSGLSYLSPRHAGLGNA